MINLVNKKIKQILVVVIISVFVVIYLLRDNKNYTKDNPKGSTEIAKNLYREIYGVYGGGVYGGDVCTVYLTDSLTFRKYVGKMFDNELIAVRYINQDQVIVLKLDLDKEQSNNVIDSIVYSMSKLKKEGKWE